MQRVGEADAALVVDVDQCLGLQAFQDVEVEVVERGRQRLGEREAFEDLALLGAGVVEDLRGALADCGGDRHRAAPRPLVGVGGPGEQPALAHRAEQVAQQPQITLAEAVEAFHGEGVQRAARTRREQLGRLLPGQRLQRETRQQLPCPQPRYGAGHGLAVGHHDHQTGTGVHGELVHERGRGVVEEVGVVHHQQPHAGEELDRAVQGDAFGEQVRERGEGQPAGLGSPGDLGAVAAPDGLGDQPGLAPARRPGHHDAVPPGRQRTPDQLQFVLPAGERPGQFQGLRVLFESHHADMSRATQP